MNAHNESAVADADGRLSAESVAEEQDFDWRQIHKRHALRTLTCDVCHQHVWYLDMYQHPTPGAEDGLLYGHRDCVLNDGSESA